MLMLNNKYAKLIYHGIDSSRLFENRLFEICDVIIVTRLGITRPFKSMIEDFEAGIDLIFEEIDFFCVIQLVLIEIVIKVLKKLHDAEV